MSSLILAIDTATPAVTAGVVRRDGDTIEVLAQRVTVDAVVDKLIASSTQARGVKRIGKGKREFMAGSGPGALRTVAFVEGRRMILAGVGIREGQTGDLNSAGPSRFLNSVTFTPVVPAR